MPRIFYSLDNDVNLEKLLESIDDLMFWCDETEVLITTGHVNLDLVQLADQLQKVKVRTGHVMLDCCLISQAGLHYCCLDDSSLV